MSAKEMLVCRRHSTLGSSLAPKIGLPVGTCPGDTSSSYAGSGSMAFWGEYPTSERVSTLPITWDSDPYLELDDSQQPENSPEHLLERSLRRLGVGRHARNWKSIL